MKKNEVDEKVILEENSKAAIDDASNFLNELNSMNTSSNVIKEKSKTKKDNPTPTELNQMSDDEVEDTVDAKTMDLFNEFSNFLEMKSDIHKDEGVKQSVSTGVDLLDSILGGGFGLGSLDIVVGQPGSGKSMIAIQTIGEMQRKYKSPLVAFLDSEEATTSKRLSDLGVTSPKINPYTDITIEKIFKFLEGLCVFKEEKKMIDIPALIVWDSIANTLSQKEQETEDPNAVIGYKARLLSILIPKYVSKLNKYNICLLAVNQLRDNLAMGQFSPAPDLKFMTSTKQMPGGNALKYNAYQLVEMKVKSALKPEKYGFEGIITKVKCVKNKSFRPNVEIEIVGDFIRGFSNFWTNFNFLAESKRIKTGAWNSLINLTDVKFRTKEAQQLYLTDIRFKESFDELSKEAIKTDIIEKYN